jgi:hypothetical protein
MQMTVATTDGESFYGFRYSSAGRSRSLFHSNDVSTLREQYPDNPLLSMVADAARLVVIRHGRRSCTPSHRPRLATG